MSTAASWSWPAAALTALLLAVGVAGVGCSDEGTTNHQSTPGEFVLRVDSSVAPPADSLHPVVPGGEPRPVSALAGEGIGPSAFVRNEIVVFSDDTEAVEHLVERLDAEVLATEEPIEAGIEAPRMHLLRVEAPPRDEGQFLDDLKALRDAADEPYELVGDFAFSDESGADLMALAVREAAREELEVAVNWVAQPHAIPDSTQEAYHEPSDQYRDAYQFPWFQRDEGLETGVADAWGLLHHADRLERSAKVAVLDMGFKNTPDLVDPGSTTLWPGFGPFDEPNQFPCATGGCPWHGTSAAEAGLAMPDNQYGSAGPGGPVAKPILVYTTYDFFVAIRAVKRAKNRGADIINMSFGAPVPWWLKWTTAGFRAVTERVRDSGVLIYASAGNNGRDVDAEKCVAGRCWEKTFHTPCENHGVTCVGGLALPNGRDSSSNYGDESVDLWAPYCVTVGPTPATQDYHSACGTSFSSPFAAGVAALVWAADPTLTADGVHRIIFDTADGLRGRKVNAFQAVLEALGPVFRVEIVDPPAGAQRMAGIPFPVRVDTTMLARTGSDTRVNLSLSSTEQGLIGQEVFNLDGETGEYRSHTVHFEHDFPVGSHHLRASAVAMVDGETYQDQHESAFEVHNPAPTVQIQTPHDGDTFCEGQGVALVADGEDDNETLGDSAFEWGSTVVADPFPRFYDLGQGPELMIDTLPVAEQRITVAVTDSYGDRASDGVDVTVLPESDPECSDLAPEVIIEQPRDGQRFMPTAADSIGDYAEVQLEATISDYEDDPQDLEIDWVSDRDGHLGSSTSVTARLHLLDNCSTDHEITLVVRDTDGNTPTRTVHVSVYIVC